MNHLPNKKFYNRSKNVLEKLRAKFRFCGTFTSWNNDFLVLNIGVGGSHHYLTAIMKELSKKTQRNTTFHSNAFIVTSHLRPLSIRLIVIALNLSPQIGAINMLIDR